MKIFNLIANAHVQFIRKRVINEVIAELEKQKKILVDLKSDELDEAYANGINMSLFIVKEMKEKT